MFIIVYICTLIAYDQHYNHEHVSQCFTGLHVVGSGSSLDMRRVEVTLGGYAGLALMPISVVQMFDCSGIFCLQFPIVFPPNAYAFFPFPLASSLFDSLVSLPCQNCLIFLLQFFLFKGFIRLIIIIIIIIIIQNRCIIQ